MSKRMHPRTRKYRQMGKADFEKSCGVYVLECEPIPEKHIREMALGKLEKFPEWARKAAEYEHVYYVGSTKHIFQRIGQHGEYGGSDFTSLFEPRKVAEVTLYDTIELAREKEREKVVNFRPYERRCCYSDLQFDWT